MSKSLKLVLISRLFAKGIDFFIALMIFLLVPINILSVMAALFYVLVADHFVRGQSVGKRLLSLRVKESTGRRGASLNASIKRNIFIGLPFVLFLFSIPGIFIALATWVIVFGVELFYMLISKKYRRLGDLLGNTEVVGFYETERPIDESNIDRFKRIIGKSSRSIKDVTGEFKDIDIRENLEKIKDKIKKKNS